MYYNFIFDYNFIFVCKFFASWIVGLIAGIIVILFFMDWLKTRRLKRDHILFLHQKSSRTFNQKTHSNWKHEGF